MKNGANYNSRRQFLKNTVLFSLAASIPKVLTSCTEKLTKFALKISGTNHVLGHRLWLKDFPKPTQTIHYPYVIVGGGITGLSAARQFIKKGIHNFCLFEADQALGGNSKSGQNAYSEYPLGAHYLPLPNLRDAELIKFLTENQIITGQKNTFPIFNEEYLCFDPNERLFIRNTWQSGLVPKYGNSTVTDQQIDLFLQEMDRFRKQKGTDGKYFFDIPLQFSSSDASLDYLDNLTLKQWLQQNDFEAEELIEYVNYCCKDDYGLGIEEVSAWAGIHYFAARKHDNPLYNDTVLTWPEGNGKLVKLLKPYAQGQTFTNHLVYSIQMISNQVELLVFDAKNNQSKQVLAHKVIVATPQYVNKYLSTSQKQFIQNFTHAPWLTATITLNEIPDTQNFPLSWDNVIYQGQGLGYIYNQHQTVAQIVPKKVITYYACLKPSERKKLLQKPAQYWKKWIISDLAKAHPEIEKYIEEMVIYKIGHGMIGPTPRFIKGNIRTEASQNIDKKIYFAHTDWVGISIFEEAFHQGITIVNTLLNDTTLDT